jgi:dTMP kinase
MASGRFITFEGGEGSGKSTQATLLVEALRKYGVDTLQTREPGGTPFAEQVRTLILDPNVSAHGPLSEALLFYAARADHLQTLIRPALGIGRWVVCDRFSDSTRVYQVEAGGMSFDAFLALEQAVVKLTFPDLTFVLDLPAEAGLARVATRRLAQALAGDTAPDTFEKRDVAFHERLREGYLSVAKADPQRCVVIDATREPEKIAAEIRTHVDRRLMTKPE